MISDSFVGFAMLPPGDTSHTSCGKCSSGPKFHFTVSPETRLTAAGAQRSPAALTSTVLAAGPPGD